MFEALEITKSVEQGKNRSEGYGHQSMIPRRSKMPRSITTKIVSVQDQTNPQPVNITLQENTVLPRHHPESN